MSDQESSIIKGWPASLENLNGFSKIQFPEITEYLSYSRIKEMNRSMAHFKYRYIDGNKPEPTKDMEFGKLLHSALLEPKKFKSQMVFAPRKEDYTGLIDTADDIKAELKKMHIRASGTKDKLEKILVNISPSYQDRLWSHIKKSYQDKVEKLRLQTVTRKQGDQILGMIESINRHKMANKLTSKGESELAAYWQDPDLGVTWLVKLDYLQIGRGPDGKPVAWITELKTTKDASPWGFPKEMDNFSYNLQNWIYTRVVHGITGIKTNLVQLAVEKAAPYGVATYCPDERVTESSEGQVRKLIKQYRQCEAEDHWPMYEEKIIPIGLPNYAYWRTEEQADRDKF